MGCVDTIDYDVFPRQGAFLHKRVEVVFHYAMKAPLLGTIVRDDLETPWQTIIKLDDGRYVLSEECQYSLCRSNI